MNARYVQSNVKLVIFMNDGWIEKMFNDADKQHHAIEQAVSLLKEYYDEMIKQGFSENAAMYLVGLMVTGMVTGGQQGR